MEEEFPKLRPLQGRWMLYKATGKYGDFELDWRAQFTTVKIICQLGSIHYLHTNSVAGGSGQRRMTLISMDTEGYSGRQIRSVSNCGKTVLFLVPLQEEMDTEPLPYNSAEFAKMPKVPCVTCNTTIPLQMLALHAEKCKQNSNVSCVYICLNCEFCIATLAQQQNTVIIYVTHTISFFPLWLYVYMS